MNQVFSVFGTLLAVIVSTAFLPFSGAAAEPSASSLEEIRNMRWTDSGYLALPKSNSHIDLQSGFSALTGTDAIRFRQIADGTSLAGLEADTINKVTEAEAIFSYSPGGYVASNDWDSVDSNKLLDQIKQLTEEGNAIRRSQHVQGLHVSGWVQKPILNSETHTISWIIKAATEDGVETLNATALKLGREGFERIVYIEDAQKESRAKQDLLLAVNSHQFDSGHRYEDFIVGRDKAAEYGVAGLVAGVLGVKLLKVAAAGSLLLGFKKLAFVLLLPLIGLVKFLKRKVFA